MNNNKISLFSFFIKEFFFRAYYIIFSFSLTFIFSFFLYYEEFFFFIIKPIFILNITNFGIKFFFSKPLDFFTIQVEICLFISVYLIIPFTILQIYFFIVPSYKKHEFKYKNYIIIFLILIMNNFFSFKFFLPFFWQFFFEIKKKLKIIEFDYFPIIGPYFKVTFIIFFFFFMMGLLFIFINILLNKKWFNINFFIKKRKLIFFFLTLVGTILSGSEIYQQLISIFFFTMVLEIFFLFYIVKYQKLL